jgi:dienelactone hydrolase
MPGQALVRIAVFCVALVSAAALAQQGPPPPPANAPPAKSPPLGPFKVVVATDPALPTHTVYRPSELAPFAGGKLPIVVWGNGGCIAVGRAFEAFLTKIASHGYFIVAIGPDNVVPPDLSARKPGEPLPPLSPSMVSKAAQLLDGLNWAVAENAREGSPYANKLNVNAVAAMGQSCGGLQTIAVSGDPRIKTSVIWNSGVLVRPMPMNVAASAPAAMREPVAKKDDLKSFHAPVAYFIGGPSDSAYENAEDDFRRIEGVPLFNANLNVGHGGTYRHVNGGWFGEVGVAWLDWRLKGDKTAGKMFEGASCGLCVDPAWTVKKKGMQ